MAAINIDRKLFITLQYAKTFSEFIYRLKIWKKQKQTYYNMIHSIHPYSIMSGNITIPGQGTLEVTNDFSAEVTETIRLLDKINEYFETNSLHYAAYCTDYPPSYKISNNGNYGYEYGYEYGIRPNIGTDYAIGISERAPAGNNHGVGENIIQDYENIYDGVTDILNSYGRYLPYNINDGTYNRNSGIWVMNSKLSTFRAYEMILAEYPLFFQLLWNPFVFPKFEDVIPSFSSETTNENTAAATGIFKIIWKNGLCNILNENSLLFKQLDTQTTTEEQPELVPIPLDDLKSPETSINNADLNTNPNWQNEYGFFKMSYCKSNNTPIDILYFSKINNSSLNMSWDQYYSISTIENVVNVNNNTEAPENDLEPDV